MEIIFKKLLGPLNFLGAKTLCMNKITKIIMISEY